MPSLLLPLNMQIEFNAIKLLHFKHTQQQLQCIAYDDDFKCAVIQYDENRLGFGLNAQLLERAMIK